MKRWLALVLFGSSCLGYTLKSDFLRVAQTFENAQFPVDIKEYPDLIFRVTIDEETDTGVMAQIERRMDGDLVSSYSGFFKFNEKTSVVFPDENMGPVLTFEKPEAGEVKQSKHTNTKNS